MAATHIWTFEARGRYYRAEGDAKIMKVDPIGLVGRELGACYCAEDIYTTDVQITPVFRQTH